ncbi:hypothetical protein [Streptomyces bauhiniae]|uniref:hypothetical protein n=1 Tax=Streptomyces bauhiniae TaxID=2340725 RepID=UPI001FCAEA88|nr:hypothetical protein [Streptomyces bauhiniae]
MVIFDVVVDHYEVRDGVVLRAGGQPDGDLLRHQGLAPVQLAVDEQNHDVGQYAGVRGVHAGVPDIALPPG